MSDVIEVENVNKAYGKGKHSVPALNGINLSVVRGEVMGFLGPNGAGKSTTIRVLLGMLKIDSGAVRLFGKDPWANAVSLHSKLAYVPGEISLWSGLTGGETIDFLSRLRDINTDSKDYKNLKDKYAKLYDLDLSKKNKTYSKGNRQKVSLVSAFVSNAELLILDEPTSGLDPLMEEVFSQCVRDYKANGATVLLSSHILSEVEKLCDRVTILRNGKDVLCDSVESLKDKHKEGETLEDVFLKEYANV